MNAVKITIGVTVLAFAGFARASDGYLVDSTGHVVRGTDGACWHAVDWANEKAVVGCDGKTAARPRPRPAVKGELIARGIFGGRLTATGFGPESPLADNKTPEGRARNRRVVAHARAETEVVETKR
jgi:hypothetical protein